MSSNSVLASSPSSTLAMLQAMARSWQSESQDQITQNIASLKANSSSMSSSTIFVGMTSGSKFSSTLMNLGSDKGLSADDKENAQLMQDFVAAQASYFNTQHSMSSKEISDLMYSGGGLATPNGRSKDTFSSVIQSMLVGPKPATELASQLSQAFYSHSMTIEKSSDVSGLDYQQTNVMYGDGSGNGGYMDETWNTSMIHTTVDSDGNYVANKGDDGKFHFMIDVGDAVSLYLSW